MSYDPHYRNFSLDLEKESGTVINNQSRGQIDARRREIEKQGTTRLVDEAMAEDSGFGEDFDGDALPGEGVPGKLHLGEGALPDRLPHFVLAHLPHSRCPEVNLPFFFAVRCDALSEHILKIGELRTLFLAERQWAGPSFLDASWEGEGA